MEGFAPGLADVGPPATASRETEGRRRPIRVLRAVGTMDRGGAESMRMEVLRNAADVAALWEAAVDRNSAG